MTNRTPDIQGIKSRMRDTWMAGDFGEIAAYIQSHADDFIDRRSITPGTRILDVACGTGNLAIPAARAGGVVTGIDIADNLIEQARARADQENLDIDFQVGDAENLAQPDNAFDLVVSMYGVMFAPRPEKGAAELVRVSRPGGTIAMANWIPDSFIGRMFRVVARHAPPPEGIPSPAEWGDPAIVRQRFGDTVESLSAEPVTVVFEYPFNVHDVVQFHIDFFGPIERAWNNLTEEGRQALRQDLEAHWSEYNQATDGTTRVEAQYLEVVAKGPRETGVRVS